MKTVSNNAYKNRSLFRTLHEILSRDQKRYFRKIVNIYSKYNSYYNQKKKNPFTFLMLLFYTIKRNIISPKRNIWLLGNFGNNLKICHANIVIARSATLGNNVTLHGNNCIGVKSNSDTRAPEIGNNVDIGYGAMLIGHIKIADNVIIGAGSIVTKDCLDEGGVYVGIPARRIK